MFPGLGADLDRPAGTRPAGHRTGLLPLAWLLSQGPVNFALPPILQKPVIKTLAQTRALPCNPVLLTASDTMSQRYNISSTNRLCPTFTGSLTQDPRDEEIQGQCEKLCSGGGRNAGLSVRGQTGTVTHRAPWSLGPAVLLVDTPQARGESSVNECCVRARQPWVIRRTVSPGPLAPIPARPTCEGVI